MSRSNVRIALAVIAWFSFLGFGGYMLFTPNDHTGRIRPKGYHEEVADNESGSLGAAREAELARDTKLYLEQTPDAPADIRAGKAYAPKEFLNEQLAEHGLEWRVRKVEGLNAVIYEVS